MQGPQRSLLSFASAGAIITLCVAAPNLGCGRSPYHNGPKGGVPAAGTRDTGSVASGGNTTASSATPMGGNTTGSWGSASSSGGATGIRLSDPYVNCGNGRRDDGETCDDGNRSYQDGCTKFCEVEDHWSCPAWGRPCVPLCGNGVVDPDETCDDENRSSNDGCSADCQKIEGGWQCRVPGKTCHPVCGDSRRVGTESCDDGNARGGDGCSRACQIEPGYVCREAGKPCERVPCGSPGADGAVPCDGGAPSAAVCGDGIVSGEEECDDGAAPQRNPRHDDDAYGGCTTACRLGPYCGDGVINGPEICDDGPANLPAYGSPGCSFACQKARYCGDGIVERYRDEMCEPVPGDRVCMPTCIVLIH